ncbi:MAG: MBL fold metallo-hydrolase [Rhodoferax sp.]
MRGVRTAMAGVLALQAVWALAQAPGAAPPRSGPAQQTTAPQPSGTADARAAQPAAQGLRFALIKTGEVHTREGLTYAQGALTRTVLVNHMAVLVEHRGQRLLFDTGLGERIDQQFLDDMPWWGKPLFAYRKGASAWAQLTQAGQALPTRIFLSHGHWDHASGLVDFSDAPVWVPQAERDFLAQPRPPAVLPSQLAIAPQRWRTLVFDGPPVAGFAASHDLFGDGAAVLLPQPGHTPGSVALLLTTGTGQRYLLVGDTVWRADAIALESRKFWLAEKVVDDNPDQTQAQVRALRALAQAQAALTIVPAHDATVHERLGYFPQWVQ